MPLFKIIPLDGGGSSAEIFATDGASALNVASQMPCREADVFEESIYRFSVMKLGGAGSFWVVFQRPA